MVKFFKSRTIYFWYITILTFIAFLPFLAPVFSSLGWHLPAKVIYFIYSFTCHQFHTRSIHIADFQYAWCARDTGIWIAFWLTAVLLRLKVIRPIHLWWLPLFVIPIALDGGVQTINTLRDLNPLGVAMGEGYYSNNLFRFMTGSFFGIGLSLFFSPQLLNLVSVENPMGTSLIGLIRKGQFNFMQWMKGKWNKLIRISFLFASLFVLYFSLVQIWDITSIKYKPVNNLDSIPKIQEGNFFQRRHNGECPTKDVNDLMDFWCFLGNKSN